MIMVSGTSVSFHTSSIFYNGALPPSGHTLSSIGSLQVPVQSGGRHALCAGKNALKYKLSPSTNSVSPIRRYDEWG